MNFVKTAILFWTVLSVFIQNSTTTQIPISVDQNGYRGLTIAVSNKIKDEENALIQKIKEWVTKASTVLYKATNNQLYFKDVTIVLPKTWSIKSKYKKISGKKFPRAHVRIDEENPVFGKTPYVFGQTACGAPGQYIHLTTYVLNAGQLAGFGDIGDVFVHEWGHLRWGLFDEYASYEEVELEKQSGYYMEDGTWKAVRCTSKVAGRNVNVMTGKTCSITSNGIPEKNCIFIPDPKSPAVASLMGHQNILKVAHFCDSDDPNTNEEVRHNSKAPNNQNTRCNKRSAWQVMREHDDFKGNTPGSPNLNTTPSFKVEIETDQAICLCLDVSGSMTVNKRSTKMYIAASNYLLNIVATGTSVAVVTFSDQGKIANNLLQINNQADRDKLVSNLPSTTGGTTSIGSGMEYCIQALNTSDNSLQGSMIYLVTDGVETIAPYIADVQPIILSSGVTVNTLALGNKSDVQLGSISRASGGQSFYYSEEQGSDSVLNDAFVATAVGDDLPIQVDSKNFRVSSSKAYEQSVLIDQSLGRDTEFQVTSDGFSNITVTATGSDGIDHKQTSSNGLTTLKIPNAPTSRAAVPVRGKRSITKAESYSVSVSSTSNNEMQAVLNIQSKTKVAGESTINTWSWLSSDTHIYGSDVLPVLYVSVMKGMIPVLKCNVTAVVEGAETSALQLKDNGIGSDLKDNDGIYSVYIFSSIFKRNGRHSIKIYVQNLNNIAEVIVVAETSQNVQTFIGLGTELVGSFQRVLLSSEVEITNYTNAPLPDSIPPSKITLKLKSIESGNNIFKAVLEWKAVGDDLDIGTAKTYDVRISASFSQIQFSPEQARKVTQNVPVPSSAGQLQQLVLTLPDATTTQYVVIRATDDNGNNGAYSNSVSISGLTDPTWVSGPGNNIRITETIIAGCIAGVILLIMFALVIYLIRQRFLATTDSKNDRKKIIKHSTEIRHDTNCKKRYQEMIDRQIYNEDVSRYFQDYSYYFGNRGRRHMV